MLTRRHFARIALILALLLVWSQQLVAAHGVVHPYQDSGSQKQTPGTDKLLCDLCVISALDNIPATLPDLGLPTVSGHIQFAEPVISQQLLTPYHYQSRAPPVLV
ncbi:hypothetical protein [Sulfuriferula thiophila]|uniref:hypothetical protein n=1 Tax=Sulfuriferula thiophila TaxID=1781211 RepID=UPI000F61577F|nr:hypothetical protein [Sulfuriferula thiophila]